MQQRYAKLTICGKIKEVMQMKVILVGIDIQEEDFEESFIELKGLASACNYQVVGTLTQKLKSINKKFYMGSGKLPILKSMIEEHHSDGIVFNNDLTPLQQKNLEDELQCEILDRTQLILNIFAKRAKTKEAKLQVEVARLSYLLPRLVTQDAHFEQQVGGNKNTRGSGEKQLELNKRLIKNRIAQLNKDLAELEKNRQTQRQKRQKNDIPLVAIVGYTNAGKSTLMNAFLERYQKNEKKYVVEKDMLFATLDTSIRHIKLEDNKEFLLCDTVGFISKLPVGLVKAFRSTLEEVLHADLILHVLDISNPMFLRQMMVTNQTLLDIGVSPNTPMIYVYNKAERLGFETLETKENHVFISAKNRINMNVLVSHMKKELFKDYLRCKMFFTYKEGSILSYLSEHANIFKKEYSETGVLIDLECSLKDYRKYIDHVWLDHKN